MVRRTLYFGNPARLSINLSQLVVELPEMAQRHTIPVEDVGYVILDHQQISLTQAVLRHFQEHNVALINCDETHHPTGLMLPLCSNTLQQERFMYQIQASQPLQKQLWAQTVKAKIINQANALNHKEAIKIRALIPAIKSGDTTNVEGRAAAIYWQYFFPDFPAFVRQRDGLFPNQLLNYGYAILRAAIARSIVAAGLLPTLGIHHCNRYNAYCLADDLMEPYRPYVDIIVRKITQRDEPALGITKQQKADLLALLSTTVHIQDEDSPLMVALSRTAVSLVKCFEGSAKKIVYPTLIPYNHGT